MKKNRFVANLFFNNCLSRISGKSLFLLWFISFTTLFVYPQVLFASSDEHSLDEVVVTAHKKKQELQDLPDSVTVFNEVQIQDAGIVDMETLSSNVPNLEFYNFGSRRHSISFMRGIMSSHAGEPATGYYVDGVSYSKSFMFNFPLFDIERVEVLRGTQGTLYGRNSIGGVINIITKKPSESISGFIGLGYGNYNQAEAKWNINAPVVKDKLFISFAGVVNSRDGYMENDFETEGDEGRHKEGKNGRFKLRYLPNDKLDITLSFDASENNDGVFPFRINKRNSFVKSGKVEAPSRYHYIRNYEGESDDEFFGTALNASYKSSFGTVSFVTGYRDYNIDEYLDIDFTQFDVMRGRYDREEQSLTQEIRLVSKEDKKFNWVAGVYYFKLDGNLDNYTFYRSGMVGSPQNPFKTSTGYTLIDSDFENEGAAIFGQATYSFMEKFDLTLGMRYEYEESDVERESSMVSDSSGLMSKVNSSGSNDFSAFLPKISGAYHITDDHMIYAGFAVGHRSGGFSPKAPEGRMAFDEENSYQYELGSKSTFIDKKLTLNTALFYNDIDNEQFAVFDKYGKFPYTSNAGESHRFGFEAEFKYAPFKGFDISGGFTLLEAEFDEHKDPSLGTDYAGNSPWGVPDYTYSLATQYRREISDGFTFMGRLEISGIGERYLDDANSIKADPYELVNAKIGLEGDSVEFYLWVKNLADKHYVIFENTKRGLSEDGEPISFGASVGYRF